MLPLRILVGLLCIAHGLVHLLYLAPDVPEFSVASSWVMPEAARRPVAVGLVLATIAGFGLLALAVWGVPGLAGAWPALAVLASVLSLVLLVAYWNARLVWGVAIDLVILGVALARPAWVRQALGGA